MNELEKIHVHNNIEYNRDNVEEKEVNKEITSFVLQLDISRSNIKSVLKSVDAFKAKLESIYDPVIIYAFAEDFGDCPIMMVAEYTNISQVTDAAKRIILLLDIYGEVSCETGVMGRSEFFRKCNISSFDVSRNFGTYGKALRKNTRRASNVTIRKLNKLCGKLSEKEIEKLIIKLETISSWYSFEGIFEGNGIFGWLVSIIEYMLKTI